MDWFVYLLVAGRFKNRKVEAMNKTIYIIGAVLLLGFIGMGAMEMMRTQVPYLETVREVKAAPSGSQVQLIGTTVPSKTTYSAGGGELLFLMKDKEGAAINVTFKGVKPSGFDSAPKVIVRGTVSGDNFTAESVQTKCPSKYEGK
jgi:cytochrome c-type biogenesis protein CcmE